ncbi:hypothetical protein C8Q77DRAFT_828341 [Trametes polyzona]|nr:hypothetical protein C8Q77DRAFT_828341 [Trametes polyzona]
MASVYISLAWELHNDLVCAWIVGMVYFCVILVLDLAGTVLDLLSLSLPGSGDYGSYPTYFIPSLMSILTSRLLLDMYETEARLQRGGASNTGSFSLNLGSNGRPGSVSMPDFITSYGGPARSFPDEGDANAGAEPIDTEEYNEGALSTASDWPNAEATTASGSGSEFGQGGITLHPGGETGGEAPQRIRPTGEMLA